MIKKLALAYKKNKHNRITNDIGIMMSAILESDKELSDFKFNDVYTILYAWLISIGHKKRDIDHVLRLQYEGVYAKARSTLEGQLEKIERDNDEKIQ